MVGQYTREAGWLLRSFGRGSESDRRYTRPRKTRTGHPLASVFKAASQKTAAELNFKYNGFALMRDQCPGESKRIDVQF